MKANKIRVRLRLGATHANYPTEREREWLTRYNGRVKPSNRGRPLEGVPPPGKAQPTADAPAAAEQVPPSPAAAGADAGSTDQPPAETPGATVTDAHGEEGRPADAPAQGEAQPENLPRVDAPTSVGSPPPGNAASSGSTAPGEPAAAAAAPARCAECGKVLAPGEKCPHEAPPPVDVQTNAADAKAAFARKDARGKDEKQQAGAGPGFNPFAFKGGLAKFLTAVCHKLVDRAAELDPDVRAYQKDAHDVIREWYQPAAQFSESVISEEMTKRLKVNPKTAAVAITVGVPLGLGYGVSLLEEAAAKEGGEETAPPSNGRPAPGWSQPQPQARGPAVTPSSPPPHAGGNGATNGAQSIPLAKPAGEAEYDPSDVSDRYGGSGAA